MQVKLALFAVLGIGIVGSVEAGRAQRKERAQALKTVLSPRGADTDSKQVEPFGKETRVIKSLDDLTSVESFYLLKTNFFREGASQRRHVEGLIQAAVKAKAPLTYEQLKSKALSK